MPRPTGLTRPQIGSGRASPGTVDVSAWSNPDQGTDGLRVHVQDPSRAHMAATIGIVDAGGYYLSDEVEGALQEIGGASSGGRQNGVVTGFGYTAVGLTVTFDTPSTALLPTLRDYSGESVTLPDNTPSVWVYISPATGLITQFLGANPPTISAPENVLLWQFATLAGAITSARDARFYVRNLDRKLPFTVRSVGSQADQESEACFVTLDAAMTYLRFAVPLGGLRTEVVVRGPVNTGPIDLPVTADGLHFRGEDGGALVLTSGGYLIDTRGRDDVTFADLLLQTDVPGASAVIDTVGSSSLLSFTRCDILSGASAWQDGIVLPNIVGRLTVSNCRISVTNTGVSVSEPSGVLIDQAEVVAVNFVPGSIGIRVGAVPTNPSERPSTVRSCSVTGFDSGIRVSGVGHAITANNVVPGFGGSEGILIDTDSKDVVVSANRVDCSVNGGLVGIRVSGSEVNKTVGVKVTGNTVYGATATGIILSGFVQETVVSDNQVDCNVPAAPSDPTAQAGILLTTGTGPADIPAYVTVSGNVVWRAKTGIYLQGLSNKIIQEIVVTGNAVHHCAVGVIAPPTLFGQTSLGIGAEWCADLVVSGNSINGIGRILTDAGTVLDPTPADVYSAGVYIADCEAATVSGNQVRQLFRKGGGYSHGIWYAARGVTIPLTINGTRITDNGISLVPDMGILVYVGSSTAAFSRTFDGAVVAGNTVNGVGAGIAVVADGRGLVSDLRVEGSNVNTTTNGAGISLLAVDAVLPVTPGVIVGAQVVDNTMSDLGGAGGYGVGVKCDDGASITGVAIDRNLIRSPNGDGINLTAGTGGGAGAANFNTISASGNEIAMSGAVGVRAIRWTSFISTPATDIDVSDNAITNTDTGIEFGISGPAGAATTVADVSVKRNTVTSNNRGIYGVVGGTVFRFVASENNIEAASNVFTLAALQPGGPTGFACIGIHLNRNRFRSVPDGINTQVSFTNMKVQDLKVEDNVFFGGLVGAGGGLSVALSGSSTGTAPALRNFVVRRNTFRDMACSGISVSVSGPTDNIIDAAISDNAFENLTNDAALARASVVLCNFDGFVRNLAVRNNQFAQFGHSTTTHGGIDLIVGGAQGIDVSGNQFDTIAATSYGNIVNIGPTANPQPLRDVSVCHNKVRAVTVAPGATTPAYIALDLRTFTEVVNLAVCDNDIDRLDNGPGNTSAVRIWADTAAYRLSCDRNRVSGVGVGAVALSISLEAGVEVASVCGNQVAGDASGGADGGGIGMYVGATSIAVRVSDNTVRGEDGTPGSGIVLQTAVASTALNGSYVERNHVRGYQRNVAVYFGSCTNLSVSNNSSTGHTETGVEVLCTGNGGLAVNLTVNGNEVRSTTDTQSNFIRVDATDSNAYENLSVCDNSTRYGGATIAAGYGIYVETGSAGAAKMENAHICRNRVLTVNNGIYVASGQTLNVRIDDNDIRDVLGGITHQQKDDVIGYSVSRNAVQARTSSNADGLIYLFHDAGNNAFHEVTVNDNVVGGAISDGVGTHGGLSGIRVGIGSLLALANARSVSVSGNQVRQSQSGIFVAFYSSNAVSVDNNKVSRTFNDGIAVAPCPPLLGGADAVDVSICGNSVSLWCESAAGNDRAISLTMGTTGTNTARDIIVANNNCHTQYDTADGFYIYFGIHNVVGFVFANNIVSFPLTAPAPVGTRAMRLTTVGAAGSVYKNFVFTGNVFRGSANGITYTAGAGGPPSECSFTGNIGDGIGAVSWGQFANGGGAGWTVTHPLVTTLPSLFTDINNNNGS